MKHGDIYRWSYNDETLKKKNDGSNGGTTYWCKSRIGVYADGRGLVDTYWISSSSNVIFSDDRITEQLEVEFIANFDDLVKCRDTELVRYSHKDFVNLNHPNSSRGNTYLRKDAVPDVGKMKKVAQLHVDAYKRKAEYYANQAEIINKASESYDADSYPPYDNDVYIPDDL